METDDAARGLFRLLLDPEARRVRLEVPLSQRRHIPEARYVYEVVITRGPDDAVEVMFDDRTLRPFCLYLHLEQRWTAKDEARRWVLGIYTPNGLVNELRCWLRTEEALPCLRSRGAADAVGRVARVPE